MVYYHRAPLRAHCSAMDSARGIFLSGKHFYFWNWLLEHIYSKGDWLIHTAPTLCFQCCVQVTTPCLSKLLTGNRDLCLKESTLLAGWLYISRTDQHRLFSHCDVFWCFNLKALVLNWIIFGALQGSIPAFLHRRLRSPAFVILWVLLVEGLLPPIMPATVRLLALRAWVTQPPVASQHLRPLQLLLSNPVSWWWKLPPLQLCLLALPSSPHRLQSWVRARKCLPELKFQPP